MEKKLTDEEIVKALDICTTEKCEEMDYGDNLADCPLRNEKYCVRKLTKNAIDLIYRLQDENKRLSLIAGMIDKGIAVEIVNMQETIDKQKAEIERLHGWDIMDVEVK